LIFFPWLLRGRQFDAILVFGSSPITQAIPAILIKWIKRAPLVLWIQDLWPESLSSTGFLKNEFLLRQIGLMVKQVYKHSDLLLVQSRAFIKPVALFSERRKIVYQPNAVMFPEKNSVEEIPVSLSDVLYKKFCVVFAGNLGFAQGLQTIIDAAINLKHHKHIRFILVGSGSRLSWLEEQKKMYGLDNLMLPGRFPSGAMPKIFSQSSALLVSLSDKPAFEKTVPSKTQMYMAAGRPILASLNGEGARIIEEAHCGFVSAAGDVNGLVGNVIRLWQTPVSERNRMGQASRVYFEREFEMETQMTKLLDKIRELKKRI